MQRKLDQSFVCAVYTMVLVVVLAISALLSGVAYLSMQALVRLRDRLLELISDGSERAMNLVHVRDYFSQRR